MKYSLIEFVINYNIGQYNIIQKEPDFHYHVRNPSNNTTPESLFGNSIPKNVEPTQRYYLLRLICTFHC
jgi:hypothetical protein